MTPSPTGDAAPELGRGTSVVAIVLAVGIALALNLIVAAVLYDAIASEGPGLSENATQILTGAFGGIIGVLGSYIGYRAGSANANGRPVDSMWATVGQNSSAPETVPPENPAPPAPL